MKYSKIAAVCVLASTCAGIAHADDDTGFYLGGGLGQAREKSGPFEGDDTSYRVFGGYSFNRYFSAETGYIDGGTTADDVGGGYYVSIERAGLYATGIGKLPIGRYFAPFAKFGYVFHHTVDSIQISDSGNDSDFIFGGGLEFRLGEKFRLRAEYDKVNLPDSAFDIFSLNAAYRF
jgi:OOP family OmpA-OmpF porin